MRALRRFVRLVPYAWAAPATALGLLCALLAVGRGARPRVVDGVLEVAGGALARDLGRLPGPCRFVAITFGHVVIATDAATLAQVRAHEQVHVRQYERWGVLFFPLYLGSSLYEGLRGRHPYYNNVFEREAYARGGPFDPSCPH